LFIITQDRGLGADAVAVVEYDRPATNGRTNARWDHYQAGGECCATVQGSACARPLPSGASLHRPAWAHLLQSWHSCNDSMHLRQHWLKVEWSGRYFVGVVKWTRWLPSEN
jgi:hypothetical protein